LLPIRARIGAYSTTRRLPIAVLNLKHTLAPVNAAFAALFARGTAAEGRRLDRRVDRTGRQTPGSAI